MKLQDFSSTTFLVRDHLSNNIIIIFQILINKLIQQNGTNKCSTCKECNDCGNFNIWKGTMAELSLSLFLMIDLKNESYIIHLDNYELYHRLSALGVWQCT